MDGNEFVEVLENAGLEPRKYSGRCMYGRHCPSVEISRGSSMVAEIVTLLQAAGEVYLSASDEPDERGWEQLCEALKGARWDSMGLDTVLYWPEVEWPEGREDE